MLFVGLPLVTSAMLQPPTITVNAGGDLQAALDQAASTSGDVTIIVAAGATFITPGSSNQFYGMPFYVRKKVDSGKITITTSGTLPSGRVTGANGMAKLVTRYSTPALEFAPQSGPVDIIGLETTNDSQGGTQLNNGLVFVGEQSGQYSGVIAGVSDVPHDISFDRCYVHSEKGDGTTSQYSSSVRGFLATAKNLTIKNSRIAGFRTFWKPGETNPLSSNALLISKGPGPYYFLNNYAEAWFGTVFTGGGPQWVINSATVASGATTTQATLTNVVGVLPRVGSYVAFEAPGMTYTVGVNHGQPYEWGAAKVTAINGNTITYVSMKSGNMQSAWGVGFGGTPLTANPNGKAVWDGDRPTNILIKGNQFVKEPVSLAAVYAQYGFGPKGHLEFKVGKTITVNANTFEGYHLAFVITPRNQSSQQEGGGKEVWSTVNDVTFSNNWLKAAPGIGQVFGIQLEDETCTVLPGSNFTSQNNLYESGTKMMNIGPAQGVKFNHDTFISNSGPAADADQAVFIVGGPIGLTIRNSIFFNNAYGFNCQVTTGCFTSKTQDHNVIIDNRSTNVQQGDGPLAPKYPSDFIAASQSAVGWDITWKLTAGSPFKGKASDGKDPGCDIDALMAALGGAPSPTPTPSVTPAPTPQPTPSPTPLPSPNPVTPPINPCVIGQWCSWLWKSTQPEHLQVMNNAMA
jgi:hypothetical protein